MFLSQTSSRPHLLPHSSRPLNLSQPPSTPQRLPTALPHLPFPISQQSISFTANRPAHLDQISASNKQRPKKQPESSTAAAQSQELPPGEEGENSKLRRRKKTEVNRSKKKKIQEQSGQKWIKINCLRFLFFLLQVTAGEEGKKG
jgi:hypothetical protein